MVMIEWKNKSKIFTIKSKKRFSKSNKFNKGTELKFKIYKDGFSIQKWSGKKSLETLSTGKMSKLKLFKILINNKFLSMKN